jgi:hypothetical protein
MIEVTVEAEILEEWLLVQPEIAQGLKRAVQVACEAGAQEAKTVHRYKDRSGNLTRSISGRVTGFDHLGATGILEATAKYASFVENGTKPHRIEARKAKALRWEGSDGEVHFAKGVNHPGTKPHPFMGPGFVKVEQVLEAQVNLAIAKAAEELR